MLLRRGQSILEYTMVVALLTVVFFYMGPTIRRGVQMLIKLTADQVGNQMNADQDFNDEQQGYMVASNTYSTRGWYDQNKELGYIPNSGIPVYATTTVYNEATYSLTNTITNAGFTACVNPPCV